MAAHQTHHDPRPSTVTVPAPRRLRKADTGPGTPAGANGTTGTSGDPVARKDPRAAAPRRSGHRGRRNDIRRAAWTALSVHAVTTGVHLMILAWLNGAGGPGAPALRDRLLAWDAQLYLSIATDGYPPGLTYGPDGEPTGNNLAFFPLYPLLTRLLHRSTGIEAGTAAITLSHLALLAALYAVHRLLTRLCGERVAVIGIVLVAGAQPMALTFLMGYSEALFLALAAGTLLAAHRHAWLTAGTLALLAGLTRPAAGAVTLALITAVALELRRTRRFTWRPLAAVALGCAGTPAYLGWVGLRTGRADAWFLVQEAGWGTHWDYGDAFFRFLADTFRSADGWVALSTAVLLVAAVAGTALAFRRDTWPPLLVYGCTVLVLTLGQSNYYHSKLRLIVPALVFLVPLALALARAGTRTAVTALTAATLFGSWYGAHMLTVWRYAI
ncbi:hypothetical protein [Streptomyces yaizuensis]|uniref:Membrane protein n=1 Tax=Streptomyces yaizuensis TaxID=2989713 RepID=A0ABQ5NYG8_9ACTN|nr:hypothetical protein [Streptomyces sp. YSPA8]GLF95403.1 membrane protein [Streptomyces sp. YSPA8]